MAINPETQYPGKIAPSTPEYPYGAARNITLPGDGTGTPWEAALVNDMFGFQQSLLDEVGVVPSSTPERVGASQYLEAINKMHRLSAPTLSNALAKKNAKEGMVVDVVERSTGNGGGGTWVYVLASSVTLNIYDAIQCTGVVTLALVLIPKAPVDFKQYGAIGDGSDETAIIHHAIDANPNSKFVLNGTFGLALEKKIEDQNIQIVSTSRNYGFKVLADVRLFDFIRCNGLILGSFKIDGNKKGQLNAGLVSIKDTEDFLVYNIHGFDGGDPLGGAAPGGVNCIGVSTDDFPGGTPTSKGIIDNCTFERFTKAPINWTTYAILGQISNNTCRDNTGNNFTPGIQVNGGSGVLVENNRCYNNEGYGIGVSIGGNVPRTVVDEVTIRGNHCFNNGLGGNETAGINVSNPYLGEPGVFLDKINVYNNWCYQNAGEGIRIAGVEGGQIKNNWCYENSTYGLSFLNSVHFESEGNRLFNNNQNQIANVSGAFLRNCQHFSSKEIFYDNQTTQTQLVDYDFDLDINDFNIVHDTVDEVRQPLRTTTGLLSGGSVKLKANSIEQGAGTFVFTLFSMQDGDSTAVHYTAKADDPAGSDAAIYNKQALFNASGGVASVLDDTTISEFETTPSNYDILANVTGHNARIRYINNAVSGKWNIEAEIKF